MFTKNFREACAKSLDDRAEHLLAWAYNVGMMGDHHDAEDARNSGRSYQEIAKKIRTTVDPHEVAAEAMVRQVMLSRPRPWRIERDWTWEVIAADDVVVAKCMTLADAEGVVALGNQMHAEMEANNALVEAELKALAEQG